MNDQEISVLLPDANATRALGARLALCAEEGDVLALHGELGAGKTCLAQGFALGLGVSRLRDVTSPTFAIWQTHLGRIALHHIDLYRLGDAEEAHALGLDEVLGQSGVCLVEWASRAPGLCPADTLEVHLTVPPEIGGGRRVTLLARGPRGRRYVAALRS